jgi:integrase
LAVNRIFVENFHCRNSRVCSTLIYVTISVILRRLRTPSSADILREMLDELKELRRSQRHIYGLGNDLAPFVRKFPRLGRATTAGISAYLSALPVGPRRRDNILGSIVEFSRFARHREHLPEDRKSAAEKIKRIKAPLDDVTIWTIPETRLLLDYLSEKWRPFITLGLFAGLRSAEILRLDWSAFEWEHCDSSGKPAPFIAVTRKVARKTRTDRVVPIAANLLAWLEPYRDRVGPLYPGNFKTNQNAHSREMTRIRRATGLGRKDNANRHSFGSYYLAVTKNYEQVAMQMGNSPRKVREHYNRPRPEADGIAFFSIRPASLENVIPLHLPLEFT